jgi:hypothetical protein
MSDKYNILGELVSPEAIKSVQNLADAVQRVADNAEKAITTLNNNKESGSRGQSPAQQAKEVERLNALVKKLDDDLAKSIAINQEKIRQEQLKTVKVEEQLQSQRENRAKRSKQLTDQERVDIQNLNQQRKLEAQAISTTATELQRLYAQQELANREAQKIATTIGVENKAFAEASLKAKNLTAEIIKLETATGKMSGKATNANYATFQLTQVMRELPNFAMSARIGFMSLSNNLPQLTDAFVTLKNSVDDTGKKLGSMGALKTFASSLLSLNTVVIIATTLMVTYGDSIVKYIESLFKATDLTEAFDLATRTLIKTMGDKSAQSTKNTEDIFKLSVAIDKYKSNTLDANRQNEQAKFIVSEYNKVLGANYGIQKDINGVMENFNKNAEKYIDYTVRMISAEKLAVDSADEFLRARQASSTIKALTGGQNIDDIKKFYSEAKIAYQNFAKASGGTEQEGANKFVADAERKNVFGNLQFGTSNSLELFRKYDKDKLDEIIKNLAIEEVATFKSNQAKTASNELYQYDLEKANKKGSSNTVQHARIKFVAEEFYNEQRMAMLKLMSKYEQEISKENLDGVLNDYEERYNANKKYRTLERALAESDYNVSIEEARSKSKTEVEEIEKIMSENKEKRRQGKIDDDELEKSRIANQKAIDTVKSNLAIKEKELNDKKNEQLLNSDKKYAQNRLKIRTDLYADEAYMLNKQKEQFITEISQEEKRQSNKIESQSSLEIGVSSFSGFKRDTSLSQLENSYNATKDKNNAEIQNTKEKIQKLHELGKKGSDEEKQLQRDLVEFNKKAINDKADYEIEKEKNLQNKLRDVKVELAQKTEELLLKIAKNGFENQLKALEKRNEKEKAINDERYKDVEDREKAGVLTKQQAEDEKARIAVYAKGQEEQIAREKLEIQKKQFYFEQGVALSKVAMSTAQGIMQAFAQGGMYATPIAIMIGALGAVQTGLILAQQPPAFKDGGEMEHDGLALVGDGGKNEVIITPDGKIGITPNKDTYMHLEAGTKILPDVNKVNMDGLMAILNVENGRMSTNVLENEIRGLRKDIRNKKTATFSNAPMMRSIEFAKNIEKRANNL